MKKHNAALLFGLALLAGISAPLSAQWAYMGGPGSCSVYGLAVIGNDLFAATAFGVFVSVDDGASWKAAGPAWRGSLPIIALSAREPDLFALTKTNLYLSTNRSESWKALGSGLPKDPVLECLLITDTALFLGLEGQGIYRSLDNGRSWRPSNAGLPDEAEVSFLGAMGQDIFAAVFGDFSFKLFRSKDNGISWVPVTSSGLPQYATPDYIAAGGDNLVMGGDGWGLETNRIFRLAAGAASWVHVVSGIPGTAHPNALAAADHFVLANLSEGYYFSRDGGVTWAKGGSGLPEDTETICFGKRGPFLFIGVAGRGLFRSSDNGATWTASSAGLPSGAEIAALCRIGTKLFAVSRSEPSGIFSCAAGDSHWAPANLGLPAEAEISDFAVIGPNLLGVASWSIFLRENSGESWKPADFGPALAKTGARLLGAFGKEVLAFTTDGTILRSEDQGRSWIASGGRIPESIDASSAASIGQDLFIGGENGIFVSRDRGTSWSPAASSWSGDLDCEFLVSSGESLVCGTHQGEYYEDPDGRRRELASKSHDNRLLRSTDRGRSWEAVSRGLPKGFRIGCVATAGRYLLASLRDSYLSYMSWEGLGLYLSTDGGASWRKLDVDPRIETQITCLFDGGEAIFAGTVDRGVWRLPVSALKKADH